MSRVKLNLPWKIDEHDLTEIRDANGTWVLSTWWNSSRRNKASQREIALAKAIVERINQQEI